MSKAVLNSYTQELGIKYPDLHINSCTPGFIETDMVSVNAALLSRSLLISIWFETDEAFCRKRWEDSKRNGHEVDS